MTPEEALAIWRSSSLFCRETTIEHLERSLKLHRVVAREYREDVTPVGRTLEAAIIILTEAAKTPDTHIQGTVQRPPFGVPPREELPLMVLVQAAGQVGYRCLFEDLKRGNPTLLGPDVEAILRAGKPVGFAGPPRTLVKPLRLREEPPEASDTKERPAN